MFVAVAGAGLTFGMWWTYFVLPQADILHARRERSFWFGYLHIVVLASIVGTGAGLHVAAYYIERHSELASVATVSAVVIPVGVYILTIYVLYSLLAHAVARLHILLVGLTAAVLGLAVLLAAHGISMANCLLVVTLAPVVSVVGYEMAGYRHAAEVIAKNA